MPGEKWILAMWWEYAIIFAGLALAALYVAWFFFRAFSGKGGCGSAACKCDATEEPSGRPLGIKTTPLVELGRGTDESQKK